MSSLQIATSDKSELWNKLPIPQGATKLQVTKVPLFPNFHIENVYLKFIYSDSYANLDIDLSF